MFDPRGRDLNYVTCFHKFWLGHGGLVASTKTHPNDSLFLSGMTHTVQHTHSFSVLGSLHSFDSLASLQSSCHIFPHLFVLASLPADIRAHKQLSTGCKGFSGARSRVAAFSPSGCCCVCVGLQEGVDTRMHASA